MHTLSGSLVSILSSREDRSLADILRSNRPFSLEEGFFAPTLEHLHDPFLLPGMDLAVDRILLARDRQERIVIFGDYDVDGVSSTAILVRFLTQIGCLVSYRLPHRAHDGYGLKDYFFTELAEKSVKLVITVDCGTRDIGPIAYAHSLAIDVIVTDHHAVPESIPTEVIALINPKRQDSLYPFRELAGAGVAFKVVQAVLMRMDEEGVSYQTPIPGSISTQALTPCPSPKGRGEWEQCKKENPPVYIIELAKSLRKGQTGAEEYLWSILRNRQYEGLKFRRQYPIHRYVADFCCVEVGLIIELDGEIHKKQKEYDEIREEVLQGGGYRILRFSNEEVLKDIQGVFTKITSYHRSVVPSPSGRGLGGGLDEEKIHRRQGGIGILSQESKKILLSYLDLAALGTVADCMPIRGENRTITTLGLRQMRSSHSSALRRFALDARGEVEGNGDLIGYQIGPRINAAGRMDTPLIALQWLLAGEDRADELFAELESLNTKRKDVTIGHLEKALDSVDLSTGVLRYHSSDIGHGVIGLVAGRLTELYHRPSIVYQDGAGDHPLLRRKGEEKTVENEKMTTEGSKKSLSIASCRSPEWCNIIELLDECRHFLVRYGGHRQAAGFTIETDRRAEFEAFLLHRFSERYGSSEQLPPKTLTVETTLDPSELSIETVGAMDQYRPYGIGNPKPLWLLQDQTILSCEYLGQDQRHLQIRLVEAPKIRLVAWGWGKIEDKEQETKDGGEENEPKRNKNPSREIPDYFSILQPGNIVSLIVELEKKVWKGQEQVSVVIREVGGE